MACDAHPRGFARAVPSAHRPASSSEPVQPLRDSLGFFGLLLLFCLPQTVVSTVAILAYVRAGIFPPFGVGTHVALVLALQILFFTGIRYERQPDPPATKPRRRARTAEGRERDARRRRPG